MLTTHMAQAHLCKQTVRKEVYE